MGKVFIYEREGGHLAVARLYEPRLENETDADYIARMIDKLKATQGDPIAVLNEEELPATGSYFGAWRWDGSKIYENASQVEEIKWGGIRETRDKLLEESDQGLLKLQDMGADTTALKKYRQQLRDLTTTYENPDSVIWPDEP